MKTKSNMTVKDKKALDKKIEEILGNFYDDAVENCMRCNEEELYNPVVTFVPKFKKAVKDLSSLIKL